VLVEEQLKLPQGSFAFLANEHKPKQTHILAIHGWLDNAASFAPIIPFLSEYNWTAVDLPGHGKSFHRPVHCHYHFIDWVTDLVDFISARYDEPVVLLGHSLGGMLSTVISGLYPELVDKVILIDAAGLMTQSPNDGAKELRAALDSRVEQKNKRKSSRLSKQTAVRARSMAGDLSEDSAELLVSRNLKEFEEGCSWRSDNRLRTRSPIRMHATQAESIIESITAPVMILLAEDGYKEIKAGIAHYQGHYQNLICMTVAGGHHCHMDNPQQCAQLISKFLK